MFKKYCIGGIIAASLLSPAISRADEYGCTVFLCLAVPSDQGGWQSVGECIAPVRRMLRDLVRGRGFPTCDMSDGGQSGSFIRPSVEPYIPCPDGTQPAPTDVLVVQGNLSSDGREYIITGTPAKSEQRTDDGIWGIGNRACVGAATGSYTERHSEYDDTINTYSSLVWQEPTPGASFDIYIGNKFYQRVKM